MISGSFACFWNSWVDRREFCMLSYNLLISIWRIWNFDWVQSVANLQVLKSYFCLFLDYVIKSEKLHPILLLPPTATNHHPVNPSSTLTKKKHLLYWLPIKLMARRYNHASTSKKATHCTWEGGSTIQSGTSIWSSELACCTALPAWPSNYHRMSSLALTSLRKCTWRNLQTVPNVASSSYVISSCIKNRRWLCSEIARNFIVQPFSSPPPPRRLRDLIAVSVLNWSGVCFSTKPHSLSQLCSWRRSSI